MKRLSSEYVDYLEAVVLSLLKERDASGVISGIAVTYSPDDVKRRIADARSQVTRARSVHWVHGRGLIVMVGRGFGEQVSHGSEVLIRGTERAVVTEIDTSQPSRSDVGLLLRGLQEGGIHEGDAIQIL